MQFVALIFWISVFWFAISLLAAVPTWLLWNWLMPGLFGLPHVTLLQAFGLLLLAGLLFGDRSRLKINAGS